MLWQRYLVAAFFCGVLSVVHAAVELSAFAVAGGGFRFIITNAETGVNSGWLSLGDSFEAYRLRHFSAADEVLTLERGDETTQLRFKRERVELSGTRVRRVLDDGGAAERLKRKVPIWVDGYGNVALGATAVTFDEIEALFRKLAEANATVEIVFVHPSFGRKDRSVRMEGMLKTKNRVLGRAQEAGLKKVTSRESELP